MKEPIADVWCRALSVKVKLLDALDASSSESESSSSSPGEAGRFFAKDSDSDSLFDRWLTMCNSAVWLKRNDLLTLFSLSSEFVDMVFSDATLVPVRDRRRIQVLFIADFFACLLGSNFDLEKDDRRRADQDDALSNATPEGLMLAGAKNMDRRDLRRVPIVASPPSAPSPDPSPDPSPGVALGRGDPIVF